MKTKLMGFALILALLCGMGTASAAAEAAMLDVAYYDFRNDIPDDLYKHYDYTDEQLRALARGSMQVHDLLPLDDGALLLVGSFLYYDLKMEESRVLGHESLPERTEAYAVAINAAGERLWSLRIGDPESYNDFRRAWRMEDGRILLQFINPIGTFGAHYFIVSVDGVVEEMLPTSKLRAAGTLETFEWYPDGFFSGGYHYDETGAIGWMMPEDTLRFIRPDYTIAWEIQDERLNGASLYGLRGAPHRSEDAFFLCGSLGREDGETMGPAALKITQDGEIDWLFKGHQYAMANISDLWPTDDGGALCIMGADPMEATPFGHTSIATLVKLDGEGGHVWTKQYEGIGELWEIEPLEDCYLLTGCSSDYTDYFVAYVDAEGTLLGRAEIPRTLEGGYTYLYAQMSAAPDGGVYLYGTESQWLEPVDETSSLRVGPLFYVKIDAATFGL